MKDYEALRRAGWSDDDIDQLMIEDRLKEDGDR